MKPFLALLQRDPQRPKAQLLEDPASSGRLKDALHRLDGRDLVDVIRELDLLLNLYEALCDHQLGVLPAPRPRVWSLADDAAQPAE